MTTKGKLIVAGILGVVVVCGIVFIPMINAEDNKNTVKYDAILIDKFTTGGVSGNLNCIYQTQNGDRYRTVSWYDCGDYVIGDKVILSVLKGHIRSVEIRN